MKRSMNMILASTMLAGQMFAFNAMANDDGMASRIRQKVEDKIKSSTLKVGGSLSLKLDLTDALQLRTKLKYEYVLDPDMGKFLREDRWADEVEARLGAGLVAERKISREMSYGRFFEDWNTASKKFLFSPLDLKDLNSKVLQERMQKGDMAQITLGKATFLGLRSSSHSTISVGAMAGKIFTGKITTKILKRADGKITLSFANADENAIKLAANVRLEVIPGLLRLKLLSIDQDFRLRGTADLATYTYDMNNEKAVAMLDQVLSAFDEPTILGDENLLKSGMDLSTHLRKGILDVTGSEEASRDANSGIVKEQKVNNNIVAGSRGNIQFSLIPGLLQSREQKLQSLNLIDMNLSGTFIKPGQYIVGYRTNLSDERSFGDSTKMHNITSVVYQPDPVLQDPSQARGYRGLHDLVGISYHTESSARFNAKEMVTYAKLCNAGLIECAGPIQLNVVAVEGARAESKDKKEMNSNYFFSRGLFEKIKARMNWSASSKNQKSDSIKNAITPIINEIVLDKAPETAQRMTNFFQEVLEKDCYSNLVGLEAKKQQGNFFKKLFNSECTMDLYNISDDLVRLNMPSLLIAMYNPEILPALSNPLARVSPGLKAELAKFFSVSYNNSYKTDGQDMVRTVNGANYGMSIADTGTSAAQVMEFTSLINTWQQQQNLTLTTSDRMKMLREIM